MLRWRYGTVIHLRRQWHGCVEVDIELTARSPDDPARIRALAYTSIVGEPRIGDQVLLNCNALAKGLGTGGYGFVVAIPERLPDDVDDPGHVVKGRYTPQQVMTLSVDEQGSPHHDTIAAAVDISGVPVVVADLHSALPAILSGILDSRPQARVCYVMTDGGALPAWFSRTIDSLAPQLIGTITVGQAFGGDIEATNLYSGLLAARHVLAADVVVVSQGPGNLGTDTRWGFSGVQSGEAVNAIAALGGRPIGALRISDVDPRERHHGISHHSVTAYGTIALAQADLPVPRNLDEKLARRIAPTLDMLAHRHTIVTVDDTGLIRAVAASPVRVSTMGRGLDEDTAYFVSQAVAGRHAAALLQSG